MDRIRKILDDFEKNSRATSRQNTLSFQEYLEALQARPEVLLRDIFQLLHDAVHYYVPPGVEEYPDDPETVHFLKYDFNRLFVKGSDNPFFADRLFSNRFMDLIDSFDKVPDWHKIYFFEGPPGSGKSTFLKNLLYRFERYMQTDEGEYYETVWRIDRAEYKEFDFSPELFSPGLFSSAGKTDDSIPIPTPDFAAPYPMTFDNRIIQVPCPNHDPPVLQIPKAYRKEILYEIITDEYFKKRLFEDKKYKWIFKAEPCTVCSSLAEALNDKIDSPLDVLSMITPRRLKYNRRLGEGISIFNPGDMLQRKPILNPVLQAYLDRIFGDSNRVKYRHSEIAKTNNGIYVVMDIKNNNQERLLNLHGIISDGIHKVEQIEENIKSVFIGLINPEDKEFVENNQSLKDRSVYIKIPYVLDYGTEIEIYRNNFGRGIGEAFLPQVLENFSKVIIASRLSSESETLSDWISEPKKYNKYCDPDLLLLKMAIYAGVIPDWLAEDDRRAFKAKFRRSLLAEAENEGVSGITGRESIYIFNEFLSLYSKQDRHINMQMLHDFFAKSKLMDDDVISEKFIDSLVASYDYTILQQIKESLYSYNNRKIAADIQDYIFAINFDPGSVEHNPYTGSDLEITETFFSGMEDYLLGTKVSDSDRRAYREEILGKYISQAVMEMKGEKKSLKSTNLYQELHQRYVRNLKANALDPFLDNENFRNAIKEYQSKEFSSHDKRIQRDVTYLIRKLQRKFAYDESGAQEICIYAIDKELYSLFKEEI